MPEQAERLKETRFAMQPLCPQCGGNFHWQYKWNAEQQIHDQELRCGNCGLPYGVKPYGYQSEITPVQPLVHTKIEDWMETPKPAEVSKQIAVIPPRADQRKGRT